jgi:hypothetical protein
MGKSLAMKILSVVAMGIVLAHMSPVAAGMLLCIADGTDPDCCLEPRASHSRVDETKQLFDGSECSCCITVDAAPSTAGATSQKTSLDCLSGSGLLRNAVSATGTRISRIGHHDPGDSRLFSLRTVVLLI